MVRGDLSSFGSSQREEEGDTNCARFWNAGERPTRMIIVGLVFPSFRRFDSVFSSDKRAHKPRLFYLLPWPLVDFVAACPTNYSHARRACLLAKGACSTLIVSRVTRALPDS